MRTTVTPGARAARRLTSTGVTTTSTTVKTPQKGSKTCITLYQTLHLWQANNLSAGVDYVHWGGHTWNTLKDAEKTKKEGVRKCEN